MAYPSQRYFGTTGEISATYRPASAPPDYVTEGFTMEGPSVTKGTAFHYLGTGGSTGGEFGLYRVDMGPEPSGPSTHFHRTISESFFVLSGALRIFDGQRWVTATSGDYLYVPVGGLHAFRNDSGEPVSMLMLFTPGAPREGYFEGLRDLPGLTEQGRLEFFIEHDSYFVEADK